MHLSRICECRYTALKCLISLIGLACLVWNNVRQHEPLGRHCAEKALSVTVTPFFPQLWTENHESLNQNEKTTVVSDRLVSLLLCNIVADKHIRISIFIFAKGTKCSGDASFSKAPNSPLCWGFWRCHWQRQRLIMGCFKPQMHQH